MVRIYFPKMFKTINMSNFLSWQRNQATIIIKKKNIWQKNNMLTKNIFQQVF
jgi:hypothetical protein